MSQFSDIEDDTPFAVFLNPQRINHRNRKGIELKRFDGTMESLKCCSINLLQQILRFWINIGDYIQSIAVRAFCDTVDIFLEREELHTYNKNKIKVILNGWFMHNPANWPPSDSITPKITSFHIDPDSVPLMLKDSGIAWLKTHGPVGCRDYWTKALLDKYGIPCYFSGCLTLTLGAKYKAAERDGKIYFVDAPLKRPGIRTLMAYIPVLATSWLKILKIHKRQNKSVIDAALFYCIYRQILTDDILLNGEFLSHNFPADMLPDNKKRFELAEELIKKYAKADLVITSLLHCALPCLGLGIPVIFIPDSIDDERFGGLIELLRVMTFGRKGLETEDETIKNMAGKISGKTKINNKREYITIKDKLEKECREFMDS